MREWALGRGERALGATLRRISERPDPGAETISAMRQIAYLTSAFLVFSCGRVETPLSPTAATDASVDGSASSSTADGSAGENDAWSAPAFDASTPEPGPDSSRDDPSATDASFTDAYYEDAPFFDAALLDASTCPFPPPAGEKCGVPGEHICGVGCELHCDCNDGLVACWAPPCLPQ